MFTKRIYLPLIGIIVLSMLVSVIGVAFAATPGGTGPDDAMSPTTDWRELKIGEIQWYAFHFDYDAARANKNIEVRLYSEPYQGTLLTVRNETQAALWRKDGKNESFGRAMPYNQDRNSDGNPDFALWSGQLRISGTYYLVVEHNKEVRQTVYYQLVIQGEGISYPTATEPAKAAEPTVAPQAAPAAQAIMEKSLAGTGPDYAMTPTNDWQTIQAGETHWYAFHFAYDEKHANEPVEIRLYSEPFDTAMLTVHNEQQAEQWRNNGKLEHFGCCTLINQDKNNDGNADYALWSGTLRVSGTYYIVVEVAPNTTGPVHYQFTVSGSGVSF
ncbi:MAG: hypothetical protein U0175_17220 [Caldilineaceae bacterium]